MRLRWTAWARLVVTVVVALGVVPLAPTSALAYRAGLHTYAGRESTWRFRPGNVGGSDAISRSVEVALFPELESRSDFYSEGLEDPAEEQPLVEDANFEWLTRGSYQEDEYDSEYSWDECTEDTGSHFWNNDPWDEDEGAINDSLSSVSGYNAWDKGQEMWTHAIDYWQAGDTGSAYFYLGKVMHLLVDQSQPAHPHEDTHALTDDDSLEDWADPGDVDGANTGGEPLVSWSDPEHYPGNVLYPPYSNEEILNTLYSFDFVDDDGELRSPLWADAWPVFVQNFNDGELHWQDRLRSASGYEDNIQQLFYLFYCVNQVGDFGPSDGYDHGEIMDLEPGDRYAPIGWVNFDEFPKTS